MNPQTESEAVSVILRIDETVDPAAVSSVRRRIDDMRGIERVVIDLADARSVDHLALAMLADDVAHRRQPRVVLRGLCEQHVRMLRYFGHASADEARG